MSAGTSGGHHGTLVKVCGLTNAADVAHAVECGAHWLGFIVLGESPRRIEAAFAGELLRAVSGAEGVAVMVGPTPAQALDLARVAGVRRVQLHGVDAAAWPEDFPLQVHAAVGVDLAGALTASPPPARHLLHLDTSVAGREGGTGRSFPWEVAEALARRRHVVLAGGLSPENVARAVAAVRPFAVDASSRLEASPGIKDPDRVRRFVDAVREQDERQR